MRGLLHEFGVIAPQGSKRFMNNLPILLADNDRVPLRVHRAVMALWEEVRDAEKPMVTVEKELEPLRSSSQSLNR